MLVAGPAKKITIHLNEDTSSQSNYLSQQLLSFLFQKGVAGASVIRPVAGFGSHHRIHSLEGGLDTNQHMPLRIEFIESEQNVAMLLPWLTELVTDGVIECQDTTIVKIAVGIS